MINRWCKEFLDYQVDDLVWDITLLCANDSTREAIKDYWSSRKT